MRGARAAFLLLPGACVAPAPDPGSPPVLAGPVVPEGARIQESAAGSFLVAWRSDPAAVPRGKPFAIEAWVFDAARGGSALEDVELHVDAEMPQHGHGMARVPVLTRTGPGSFRAEGLYFHMPGEWQLHLDVTRGAWTERAQVALEVE